MPEGSDTEGQLEKIPSRHTLEMHAFWAYDLRWCMPAGSDTEGQLEEIPSRHTLEMYARRQ